MKTSGSYGEKFDYKLPHITKGKGKNTPAAGDKDINTEQAKQSKSVLE